MEKGRYVLKYSGKQVDEYLGDVTQIKEEVKRVSEEQATNKAETAEKILGIEDKIKDLNDSINNIEGVGGFMWVEVI